MPTIPKFFAIDNDLVPISLNACLICCFVVCFTISSFIVGPAYSNEDINKPNAAPIPKPRQQCQLMFCAVDRLMIYLLHQTWQFWQHRTPLRLASFWLFAVLEETCRCFAGFPYYPKVCSWYILIKCVCKKKKRSGREGWMVLRIQGRSFFSWPLRTGQWYPLPESRICCSSFLASW